MSQSLLHSYTFDFQAANCFLSFSFVTIWWFWEDTWEEARQTSTPCLWQQLFLIGRCYNHQQNQNHHHSLKHNHHHFIDLSVSQTDICVLSLALTIFLLCHKLPVDQKQFGQRRLIVIFSSKVTSHQSIVNQGLRSLPALAFLLMLVALHFCQRESAFPVHLWWKDLARFVPNRWRIKWLQHPTTRMGGQWSPSLLILKALLIQKCPTWNLALFRMYS